MQLYTIDMTNHHPVDLSKAMVIDTHSHTQTCCMLESWHIQHQQAPLNRDRGTLPGLYAALLAWLYTILPFFYYCVITLLIFVLIFPLCFAFSLG